MNNYTLWRARTAFWIAASLTVAGWGLSELAHRVWLQGGIEIAIAVVLITARIRQARGIRWLVDPRVYNFRGYRRPSPVAYLADARDALLIGSFMATGYVLPLVAVRSRPAA